MHVRHEIRTAIYALFALQFVTAIGGSWLLARTGPAIANILAENDTSLAAAEAMNDALQRAQLTDNPAAQRARFDAAFDRARNNITETAEGPILDAIGAKRDAAFQGSPEARLALLDQLSALASINRASIHKADASASSLALTGAWALGGLALLALVLSLSMIRRANQRLLIPIHRLHTVAQAWREGDGLRRCELTAMPIELRTLGGALNDLLDVAAHPPSQTHPLASAVLHKRALHAILDHLPHPAVLFDDARTPLAANPLGLSQTQDAAAALTRPDPAPWVIDPLNDGLTLATLPAPKTDDDEAPPNTTDATDDAEATDQAAAVSAS